MAQDKHEDGEVTSAAEQDEQGPGPGMRGSGKQFSEGHRDSEPGQEHAERDEDDVPDGSGKQFGKKNREHPGQVAGSGKQFAGDQDEHDD